MAKEIDDVYRLYKTYADICVNENEYNKLVSMNRIPHDLRELFDGTFVTNSQSVYDNDFSGEMVKKIAQKGEKVFLHDSTDHFSNMSNAYFFYDDFLVIVPVGSYNLGPASNHYRYRKSQAKSIAIPLKNIENIHYKKGTYGYTEQAYNIILKFVNGKSVRIDFCRTANESMFSTKRTWVPNDNWSFNVNIELLGLSKIEAAGADNCCKVEQAIKKLIEESTNYTEIDEKLGFSFKKNCIYELSQVKYDKSLFLEKVLKYQNDIIDNEKLRQDVNKYAEALQTLENDYASINKEYENALNELNNAGIFGKSKKKKNLESIEQRKKEIEEQIQKGPEETYQIICNDILSYGGQPINHNSVESQRAVEFYKTCKGKNISNPEDDEQSILFEMLYKKSEIESLDRAIQLFHDGYEIAEQDEINKKKRKQIKDYTLAVVKYNEEKELAEIIGYNKYIKTAVKEAKAAEAMQQATNLLGQLANIQSQTQAVKSDAAIWGGIANGLAGPAAGVMTAVDIEASNRKAERDAAEIRERGRASMAQARQLESMYGSEAIKYSGAVSSVTNRMCDVDHKEKYFKYLSCEVTSYDQIADDVLNINADIIVNEPVVIGDTKFVLDGSLKINIKHNGQIIGDAYISAPGYDNTNIKKAGFDMQKSYSATGMIHQKIDVVPEQLEFEFVPHNMWIIEQ